MKVLWRERRAQSTTDSRRHLAGLFTVAAEAHDTVPLVGAQREETSAEIRAGTQGGAMPVKTQGTQDVSVAAQECHGGTVVTSPAAQDVACMVQEAGFADVLVVDNIMAALERNPSGVSYVLRAVA